MEFSTVSIFKDDDEIDVSDALNSSTDEEEGAEMGSPPGKAPNRDRQHVEVGE